MRSNSRRAGLASVGAAILCFTLVSCARANDGGSLEGRTASEIARMRRDASGDRVRRAEARMAAARSTEEEDRAAADLRAAKDAWYEAMQEDWRVNHWEDPTPSGPQSKTSEPLVTTGEMIGAGVGGILGGIIGSSAGVVIDGDGYNGWALGAATGATIGAWVGHFVEWLFDW